MKGGFIDYWHRTSVFDEKTVVNGTNFQNSNKSSWLLHSVATAISITGYLLLYRRIQGLLYSGFQFKCKKYFKFFKSKMWYLVVSKTKIHLYPGLGKCFPTVDKGVLAVVANCSAIVNRIQLDSTVWRVVLMVYWHRTSVFDEKIVVNTISFQNSNKFSSVLYTVAKKFSSRAYSLFYHRSQRLLTLVFNSNAIFKKKTSAF